MSSVEGHFLWSGFSNDGLPRGKSPVDTKETSFGSHSFLSALAHFLYDLSTFPCLFIVKRRNVDEYDVEISLYRAGAIF